MKLPDLLAEIDRLDQAGTQGPWKAYYFSAGNSCVRISEFEVAQLYAEPGFEGDSELQRANDAILIATYRNATPKIARALRTAVEALRDVYQVCEDPGSEMRAYKALAAIEKEVEG